MSLSLVFKLTLAAASLPSLLALPHIKHSSHSRRSSPLKIIQGNDDGWAEANLYATYKLFQSSGYDTFVSSPVNNESGTGSLNKYNNATDWNTRTDPTNYAPATMTSAGEYNSVPSGAPGVGSDPDDSRRNYVDSYPATAIDYGVNVLQPKFWGDNGKADLAVTGPNVGQNVGLVDQLSGTVGAAIEAVKWGIPAIAISSANKTFRSYTTLQSGDADSANIFAQLSLKLVQALQQGTPAGQPLLPAGYALNVNLPNPAANCSTADQFKFEPTTIFPWPLTVLTGTFAKCNSAQLRDESGAFGQGCTVTVSVMNEGKIDVPTDVQNDVFDRLASILVCPDSDNLVADLVSFVPVSEVTDKVGDLLNAVGGLGSSSS